jgi:hypothetical protein
MKTSSLRPFAAVALPFILAACSGMPSTGSGTASTSVPAAIAVPSGNKLAFTLQASGMQNYECRAKADASGYDWAFVSPEAALRDKSDTLVGRHYAGPTWEYGDSSKVTGKVVADAASPTTGNIPWLLLKGTPSGPNGVFAGVTYVQRTNTNGGTAPSDICNASLTGSKKAVRYTADYLFYKS